MVGKYSNTVTAHSAVEMLNFLWNELQYKDRESSIIYKKYPIVLRYSVKYSVTCIHNLMHTHLSCTFSVPLEP